MVQEHGVTVAQETVDVANREGEGGTGVQLTDYAIQVVQRNIKMAEKLVMSVMELNVDYGTHPGTSSMALRDPGAAKICNAFGVYPQHTNVPVHQDNDDAISYIVDTNLINRETGRIVANGIGGCTSNETKYRRWVENPAALGIDPEGLKTREKNGKKEYRIPNPDFEDLGNTILKMAAKRSEIDACQSLPGVASALRKLFDPNLKQTMGKEMSDGRADYTLAQFWQLTKDANITEEEVHKTLGVASMKTWMESRTLREAVAQLLKITAAGARSNKKAKTDTKTEPTKKAPEAGVEDVKPEEIAEAQVKTVDALVALCNSCWGMSEQQVFKELGYANRANFVDARVQSPWIAWLTILDIKHPKA